MPATYSIYGGAFTRGTSSPNKNAPSNFFAHTHTLEKNNTHQQLQHTRGFRWGAARYAFCDEIHAQLHFAVCFTYVNIRTMRFGCAHKWNTHTHTNDETRAARRRGLDYYHRQRCTDKTHINNNAQSKENFHNTKRWKLKIRGRQTNKTQHKSSISCATIKSTRVSAWQLSMMMMMMVPTRYWYLLMTVSTKMSGDKWLGVRLKSTGGFATV